MTNMTLRIEIVENYLGGRITAAEASRRLDLHRVSFWRMVKKYEYGGPRGLEHGLRGRPSNNSKPKGSFEKGEMI